MSAERGWIGEPQPSFGQKLVRANEIRTGDRIFRATKAGGDLMMVAHEMLFEHRGSQSLLVFSGPTYPLGLSEVGEEITGAGVDLVSGMVLDHALQQRGGHTLQLVVGVGVQMPHVQVRILVLVGAMTVVQLSDRGGPLRVLKEPGNPVHPAVLTATVLDLVVPRGGGDAPGREKLDLLTGGKDGSHM